MELYTFNDLLADAFFRAAIRGVKRVVATESAASSAYLAITVRAAESCVDADFLDTTAELAREVRGL